MSPYPSRRSTPNLVRKRSVASTGMRAAPVRANRTVEKADVSTPSINDIAIQMGGAPGTIVTLRSTNVSKAVTGSNR